jgi:nucleotide-binding universal stress UspA family protein
LFEAPKRREQEVLREVVEELGGHDKVEGTLWCLFREGVPLDPASELHVVHVGEYLPTFFAETEMEPAQLERKARNVLDKQAKKIEAAGKTVTEAHLRLGRAPHEILAVAEQIGAGVVVIGSRGLGGLRRAFLGSVSDLVVRHAHCPVFVVRKEEYEAAGLAEGGTV